MRLFLVHVFYSVVSGKVERSVAYPLMQAARRSTLTSGTFFHGKFFPLLLIQEEQDVSYWRKNGH